MQQDEDVKNFESNLELMDRYSRAVGELGAETQAKLTKMDIFIAGMRGVGIETAKNLILAGPRSVTLYDPQLTQIADLGSNFFLNESHVGTVTRAEAVVTELRKLNKYVRVEVHSGDLQEADLAKFNVCVFTNTPQKDLLRFNKFCRSQTPAIGFIAADIYGLAASAFLDYGDEFVVNDTNGEPPSNGIVLSISHDANGLVVVDKPHGLQSGDVVRFREVEGMTQLNDREFTLQPYDGPNSATRFCIGDTTQFSEYTRQGLWTQVKKPKTFSWSSLEERIKNPKIDGVITIFDFTKFDRAEHLHIAFQGLQRFREANNNCLPESNNEQHIQQVIEFARQFNQEMEQNYGFHVDEVDVKVVSKVARHANCQLNPMATLYGGVIAQEVVKYTGKYMPMRQWFLFESFEALPPSPPSDTQPLNSRYDDQIAVFGQAFQQKLTELNYFMVGCGALGCELLKNYGMMGVGCSPAGCIHITDMDRIEVSNLNRQFLFRDENVGQLKSVAASDAIRRMNPAVNVKCYETRVGPDTESTFHDNFWQSLSGVVNALDNITARKYVDQQCVLHHKTLLESGTLGTKANTMVIIPELTQSYSDVKDTEEDAIPMCTLRNFPHIIDHCCEWARAEFENVFAAAPQDVNNFLENREDFLSKLRSSEEERTNKKETLEAVVELLQIAKNPTFEACVRLAQARLLKRHRDIIMQLVQAFPEDAKTRDGNLFWSGEKRFPSAAQYDPNDEFQIEYLTAAANLYAQTLNLPCTAAEAEQRRDRNFVRSIASQLPVPEPVLKKSDVKENEDGSVDVGGGDADLKHADELLALLEGLDVAGLRLLMVHEFEKDDDRNYHIDFIAACANLRALNYRIGTESRHKVKMIAGKIIAALATTTAMATGLVCLELYKLQLGLNDVTLFRESNVNLANPSMFLFEPNPPQQIKSVAFDPIAGGAVRAVPEGFTKWNQLVIDEGDLTLQQFLDAFKAKTGLNVVMLFKRDLTETEKARLQGQQQEIFNSSDFPPTLAEKNRALLPRNLKQLFVEKYGELPEGRTFLLLDGDFEDDNMDSCRLPMIKYVFRNA